MLHSYELMINKDERLVQAEIPNAFSQRLYKDQMYRVVNPSWNIDLWFTER